MESLPSGPGILILGTGALATLFAARLGQTGMPVTMLGHWPQALRSLNREGARLLLPEGQELSAPVRALSSPEEAGVFGLALVLLKAWQTPRAGRQLQTCLAADGLALTLQNGLGNLEILRSFLGSERCALGVCTLGAALLGPGLTRLGGEGTLSLQAHPRLGPMETLLRAASFPVNIFPDAAPLVWGKLVVNSAINPLTALLQISNGELLRRPGLRALMGALACETAAVARAGKILLPFDDPVAAVEQVAQRTAVNHSSMAQDVQRGAPTEIEAICGAVVRAAKEWGQSAPLNWAMWQLLSTAGGNREEPMVK